MAGDREELKRVQKELKTSIKKAKEEYKSKLENKLELNNTHDVWRGLKDITGFNQHSPIAAEGKREWANEFNQFFVQFDNGSAPAPLCLSPAQINTPTQLHHGPSTAHLPPPQTMSRLAPPSPVHKRRRIHKEFWGVGGAIPTSLVSLSPSGAIRIQWTQTQDGIRERLWLRKASALCSDLVPASGVAAYPVVVPCEGSSAGSPSYSIAGFPSCSLFCSGASFPSFSSTGF
ncbi:hypothetical protein AOLI_G00227570 [Acnodon oligacanthus]